MINKKLKWKVAIIILAIAMITVSMPFKEEILQRVQFITSADVIVLDPGHGGIDGGAVNSSGTCEKDINLAIALKIKKLAEADGWHIVMTREEDKGLYSEDGRSIRSHKTEDLLERKKIIEKTKPLMTASIHLNSFKEDPSVRGAQVFYSTGGSSKITEEGKKLAELIQEELVKGINDGTNRVALGKKDVLILKNPVAPTVIIECGFLSNRAEAELLLDEKYQEKLAKFIYKGMLTFSNLEPQEKIDKIDSLHLI
ncbi:N-acetylmuramoyl-L-alanine amidase [Anaerovorax odorimutans]|uniref:N-acetylmuramoyl-L-alanine amidase n=1 Tax=Anaerovorax odorimutans TaxID=109327 RepID=UPI00041046E8|nr:N-acetylmuramoyl-L-alanine amidase [Anaerovorax odorimutans]